MSIDNDKFQFVSQFNCTHFNYLYANFTRCTHFSRGVRKLYQNRYLHTYEKRLRYAKYRSFLFLSVFSLFCSKEDLKSKKYGVVLFSPSVLKTKSSVDTIRRTVRLIMNVIAFLLLIFWLFSGCFRLFLIMTRELQDVCVIPSRIAPPL